MSKILIADDSATILEMIGAYLRDAGYDIVTATDGVEAVEKAFTERPDLIVLDIMMPRMNGYQTCRYLKNEDTTSHIPIILFTSKDQPADKFWGLQTGAEKYILKDMWRTDLLEAVECLLISGTPSPVPQKLMERLKPPGMAEILSRINELLDNNLYEATIMNQIGRLSLSSDDLLGTVKALFQLYETLISFPLGAIILGDREEYHIYIKVNSKVGTNDLDRLEGQIIKIFTDALNEEDLSENKSLQIIVRDDSKDLIVEGECFIEDLSQRLCHIPTEKGVKIAGLITFCLPSRMRENAEEREKLKRISRQAFIVLQDALLFDRLSSLAVTDALTGLYNRRHFFQALDREYNRTVRHGAIFSLAIMDIDHFKSINDNYGHIAGDFVLKEMALIVQGECRKTDLFARFGGEEFSLLLMETPIKFAKTLCERIREKIENHEFITPNQSLKITVSMGITEFSGERELSQEKLISLADEAMYLAKSLGRNRVCVTESKR